MSGLFDEEPAKPARVSAKQKRLAAPAPVNRSSTQNLDPEIKALRMLDRWGMLGDDERSKHADVLESEMTAKSREEFREWRKNHGTDH